MRPFYPLIAVICLLITFALNSYEDTLAHHYKISVFAELGEDSFWYPDWTRKYKDVETLERKGFWFIAYPAWFYDGWHLIKVFRYLFLFYAFWFIFIHNTRRRRLLKLHWALLGTYWLFWSLTHLIFYNYLLITK